MRRVWAAALGALALAGCVSDEMMTRAYPDRASYAFRNSDGSEINRYLCERGADEAETRARAAKAHSYFDARIERAAEAFADAAMKAYDAGKGEAALKPHLETLEAEAVSASAETERRFECLFIGADQS